MPHIEFDDWSSLIGTDSSQSRKTLVNIRGTNGSGKSTIPISMRETDHDSYEVWYPINDRKSTLFTVFPSLGWLAIGHYHSKCGGLDTMRNTHLINTAIETACLFPYNILAEGVIASTVSGNYIRLFSIIKQRYPNVEPIAYTILTPVKTCIQRVYIRNGGTSIKDELIMSKRKQVQRCIPKFMEAGIRTLETDNSNISREDTLDWFLGSLNMAM